MKNEMESAQAEIDQWWSEKQEEAKQEARRMAEEASEQGFQAGFEQGKLLAEEEFRQKREEMHDIG